MVPHVIVPQSGGLSQALEQRGVPVCVLPVQTWVTGHQESDATFVQRAKKNAKDRAKSLLRLAKNAAIMASLVRQLQQWNVDLIYSNSSVVPTGAVAAALTRRPHVWHLREFVNTPDAGLSADWGLPLYRTLIGQADAQIAISRAIRDYYLPQADPTRVATIYNGVATRAEFDRWAKRVEQAGTPDLAQPYTFLIVGGISPSKGQREAVEALALVAHIHPAVRLLVVGGGPRDALEQLAMQRGIADKIEYWGYTDDPNRAYLACDAVLVCSRSEGMGRAAAEAMAACRPVIGLNRTATPEIVEDGVTGLLYDGGAEALAACMRAFVEQPAWARSLGMAGWQVAREKYNVEAYAQNVYAVLERVWRTRGQAKSPTP